ncbi:MAG: hypothetical protein HRU14_09155 [Planctomycetes bacterium]|nr:hypothetical protein [Planctomycetota bacterium]
MHRLFLSALTVLLLVGAAPSQTLAHSVSANSLLYLRSHSGDPIEAMKTIFSGGGLYSTPVDIDGIIDALDDGLQMAGDMMDLGDISLGNWLRSIQGYEAALTRFELMDGFPEFDFVLVLHTTMAEQIYEVISGKLIEGAVADEVSKDEMEMSFGETSMNVGRHGDMIIVASDQRQLRETMKNFGAVKQGSLAQSPAFKRAMGSDDVPKYCAFVNAKPLMKILREEAGSWGGNDSSEFELIAGSLGLFKLAAFGWNERDDTTHIAIVGDGNIPLFEMLDSGKGGHEALDIMPADVAFAMAWNGSADTLWKKITAFLLDDAQFPMAPMFREQLISLQKQIGIRIEDIAAVATGGMSMAVMPDDRGRIDRFEENFFVIIGTDEPEKAQATIGDLMTKMLAPRGGELMVTNEGDRTWFRAKMPNERKTPCMVFDGNGIIIAMESAARRALEARSGNFPTLARYGVCKGLPQQASVYSYVSLKAAMAQESQFAAAYASIRDGAGIATAINVDPDRIVIRTSKPVTQILGAFGAAGVIHETQKKGRRAIMKDLETIAKAYREYKAKNGKDPATLSALGLTGDKALNYPPNRPANVPGKSYKLISTEGADPEDEWGTIVVVCPDNRFGRLVGLLSGDSRPLSERQFRTQFTKQRAPK